MSVNGTETIAESKGPQSPPANGRATRVAADSKATPARGMTTRRRRDRQDSEKSAEERFFLATGSRNGDLPALGRECTSEADAIIKARPAGGFKTLADLGKVPGIDIKKLEPLKDRIKF